MIILRFYKSSNSPLPYIFKIYRPTASLIARHVVKDKRRLTRVANIVTTDRSVITANIHSATESEFFRVVIQFGV